MCLNVVVEYYLAIKNKILPFAATWIDLEIIILSEINQRKTKTVSYHSYEKFKKNDANELICETEIDSQT